MKKIIIIILIVALLGGVAFIFLNKGKAGADFESVLPAKPVVYMEMHEVEASLERLLASEFFNGLAQMNEALTPVGNPFKQFKNLFESNEGLKPIRPLLKHKIALAVYELNIDFNTVFNGGEFPVNEMLKFLDSFYLAIELDSGTKAVERVLSTLKPFGKDITAIDKIFSEEKYHVLATQGQEISISYIRFGDILLLSLSEPAIQKAISVYKGAVPSLANDTNFQEVTDQKSADSFSYYSFTYINAVINSWVASIKDPVTKAPLEQSAKYFQGLNAGIMSFDWNDAFRTSYVIDYELSQINPDFHSSYAGCIGTKNTTLKYVPEQVLGYYWGGCINWRQMYDEFNKGLAQQGGAQNPMAQGALGVAGQYIDLLGADIGGYLLDIQQGLFPTPNLVLFIGIKDVNTVKTMLNPLLQNPMLRLEQLTHAGQEVTKVNLPVNVITPGFTFMGNHLVIATHIDQLKSSIDLSKGQGKSLKDNSNFKSIKLGAIDDGSGAQYYEIVRLVEKLMQFEDFGKNMVKQQSVKKEAFRNGAIKRLEDVQSRVTLQAQKIQSTKTQILELEDQIFLNESKLLDTTKQTESLNKLKTDLQVYQKELEVAREQEEEALAVLTAYEEKSKDAPDTAQTVDSVALPLLNAFKSVEVLAVRMRVEEKNAKTEIILKVK